MKTEQVRVLVGKNVEMVCFAQFGVYIHLEGGILLTVESEFEHGHNTTGKGRRTTFPVAKSSLMTLLACSVNSASLDASGDLHLTFSNGDTLRVWKQPHYESYRLGIAGEELIA